MQVPTWLKPAIMGAVAGGIATMIVGFNYGGWYLGSSAETLANKQSNGWATMPKADAPNQDLASACADVLAKTAGS